jgi:hypothetical protein
MSEKPYPPLNNGCESCGAALRQAWHQTRPVERWLCPGCGERDQRAGPSWRGTFYPDIGDMDSENLARLDTDPSTGAVKP